MGIGARTGTFKDLVAAPAGETVWLVSRFSLPVGLMLLIVGSEGEVDGWVVRWLRVGMVAL